MRRETIKWQPFNAVANGKVMVDEVLREKNKIRMPILSDDQNEELQRKLVFYYNSQEIVKIRYFKAGSVYNLRGIITNIDYSNRKLVMDEQYSIFFSQIIDFL